MKIICFLKIVSDKRRNVANLNHWWWSNLPLSSKILISIPRPTSCLHATCRHSEHNAVY